MSAAPDEPAVVPTAPPPPDLAPPDLEWIRRRVLNVVGHELRTPTATVRGLAEVLAAGVSADELPQLSDALLRSSRRLEKLVDDLLAAAEISTTLPGEQPSEVGVANTVREVWNELGGDPIGLVVHGEASWWARPTSVRRIVTHLLDNAIKYGQGTADARVTRTGDTAQLVLASPGPELPPEDVRNAVEMFWRGERAVTATWGLGLGLSVSKVLAVHEAGALWVGAHEGGGLDTSVALPAFTNQTGVIQSS